MREGERGREGRRGREILVIKMVMMIMRVRVSWNDSAERGWREVCEREIDRKKR